MVNAVEILAALAGFILLHELGHFLACRLFHIDVEEFGIGFPPRITTLFVRKGTKYTLNAIPLGGFVRPKGEGDPDVPGSIESASPWARLGVYLAGPVVNFILGVVLLSLAVGIYGAPVLGDSSVQVLDVVPGAPADTQGLQVCDRIVSFNGTPVQDVMMMVELTREHAGQSVVLHIIRDGVEQDVTVTPRAVYPPDEGALGILIAPPLELRPVSPVEATLMGFDMALGLSWRIITMPVKLVSGAVSYQENRLMGLKGMVDVYSGIKSGDVASCDPKGLNMFSFLASLTLSLAAFNLLPFPALDGGRIALLLPEIFFKRRIPPKYENIVHMLGFLILLVLLVIINIQDFVNPLIK